MGILSKKLAINLGSRATRIYVPKKGLVVNEPSVLAFDKSSGKIIAVGTEAEEIATKTPEDIGSVWPLSGGVISDFRASVDLIRALTIKAVGPIHLFKPQAIITTTDAATPTEQRAVVDAGESAGLQNVALIGSSLAAALGAGMPVQDPQASMVIDIGSSTTDIGVYSLGGTVSSKSVRTGGDGLTEAVRNHLKQYYGLVIGRVVADDIKHRFVSLGLNVENSEISVNGVSLKDSLPKTVKIASQELRPIVEATFERTILALRTVIEKTPADLVADISEHGIFMAGGGSQLRGLSDYLSARIRAEFSLAQDPELCGVKGANIALTHLSDYHRQLSRF